MANTKAALLQTKWTSLPATLRRFLALAADVALYGFVAAMWVNNAAYAAGIFSRWACGEGSLAAATATKVFNASMLAMWVFIPFAAPLLMWRIEHAPEARESGGGGGGVRAQALAVQHRRRDSHGGGNRPVALVGMFFACSLLIGGTWLRDFAPEMGSCQDKVGSVLADVGGFVNSVMQCFIFAPNLVIFLMRDSRM